MSTVILSHGFKEDKIEKVGDKEGLFLVIKCLRGRGDGFIEDPLHLDGPRTLVSS